MKSSEKEFIAETEEILEDAGEFLIRIQESPKGSADPDIVNALFRAMHTLKGMASLFGYQAITDISHSLENLLDDVRLGKIEITEEVVSFLFQFIDILRTYVDAVRTNKPQKDREVHGHLEKIRTFRDSLSQRGEERSIKGLIADEILRVLSEYEEHRLKSNIKEKKGIYYLKSSFSISDFDVHLKEITEKVKTVGELISTMPTSENLPEGSIGFNLMIGSSKDAQGLQDIFGMRVDVLIPTGGAQAQEPTGEQYQEKPSSEIGMKVSSSTLRVDIEKIDMILNTIGELALVKGAHQRVWAEMSDKYGHRPIVVDLYRVGQSFQRRLDELKQQVLSIRMVPVGQIFGRLGQITRRYSRSANKKIELKIFGENTEIDKFLAEEVIDPLMHIVRNAIDHGIESTEQRLLNGKGEQAEIVLKAYQRGNNVVIEVEDDGKGLDINKIKSKAVEKGLISEKDTLSEHDAIDMIFLPGLSTSETVSEISGRGVGLDVVKQKLGDMGGFVDVITKKNEGTRFILTLPITLAIIKALIVRIGTDKYAIPLSSLSETFALDTSTIQLVENKKVCNLRGQMLPLTDLCGLLGLGMDNRKKCFVAVIGHGQRRVGLMVDELIEQYEVVIKPLGSYLEDLKIYAGAAELGRNEVVLVLDGEAVIEQCISKKAHANV